MIMKKVLKTFSSASFIAAAPFLLTCSLGAKIIRAKLLSKRKFTFESRQKMFMKNK